MTDKEQKARKLNKLMDIALIVMGIIIAFNITYIIYNEYGNCVDSGVIMKMMYLWESDEPIDELIEAEGWKNTENTKEMLRNVSDWIYQNVRYRSVSIEGYNNAYATLKNGFGDCLGQAHLAYIIFGKLNVDAYLLQFINGNIGHAVNLIRMEDGSGYYVMDTTIHFFGPAGEYFKTYDHLGIDYSLPEYWAEKLEL